MKKRKIISYILIPILSVYLLICNLFIISFADIPATQKVVSHTGTWTGYGNVNITGLGKYYTLEDTTGLTQSTYALPKYFYTKDNITFSDVSGVNLVINQLNKVVGVVLTPEQINTFYQNFFTKIGLTNNDGYAQGGLYDLEGNFYGYCLNDISGCYYNHVSETTFNVPSYLPNNIYNFFTATNDFSPPYIRYIPSSLQNIKNNLSGTYTVAQLEAFDSLYNDFNFILGIRWDTWEKKYKLYSVGNYHKCVAVTNPAYFVASNTTSYSQISYTEFCRRYNLTDNYNELSFSQLSPSFGLALTLHDENGGQVINIRQKALDNTDGSIESLSNLALTNGPAYGNPTVVNTIGNPGNTTTYIQTIVSRKEIYIYKSLNTVSLLDTKTYVPQVLTTNKYTDYNINNDNSNTVSTNSVDNSVTYNETIYNDVTEDYSQYIDNRVIDNSSVTNNVTNITNNYYGNSGGGNGGNNGGENNNDGILDTLLSAILGFFDAIGKVIATIITGLLDMFSSVLSAIADLTTDLTGFTDFLGSLFGWLPEPIPQVLGVGISICILCAVIRFIRG